MLGNLSFTVKKLLTVTVDIKTTFKLQDFILSVYIFWSLFWIWKEVLPKSGNLTQKSLLGTLWTLTLGLYKLLRTGSIREPVTFGG